MRLATQGLTRNGHRRVLGNAAAAEIGIKPGMTLHVVDAPLDYSALDRSGRRKGGLRHQADQGTSSCCTPSSRKKGRLQEVLDGARAGLGSEAIVCSSWPKKAAGIPSEVTEDTVRDLALPLGFVDVKVCAVDNTWSGLKLVVRKTLR